MKALAVATSAYVHLHDESTYEKDDSSFGERVKAQLFTPTLTDPTQITYYVKGDGKNIYLEEDRINKKNNRRHIHLVYDGPSHFNSLVPESAADAAV